MAFDLSSLKSIFNGDSENPHVHGSVIGIDIGSSSVKIVQLKEVRGIPTLETYGELQLGPYEGVDIGRGTHLPASRATEALVDIMREAGATANDVAFALSYNSSFITTIPIPTADNEKIRSMVPVEARKYIPVSLTKVSLEWFPLSVNFDTKITNTLISAVYLESRERYEKIMSGSNLHVLVNEVEIFSTVRSALASKDTTVAVLDFGASATRMYIVREGAVVKTHSVLLSGVELSETLHKTLDVNFKSAEELKREVGVYGKESDPRIQKATVATLDRGLRELHMVIKRYGESEGIAVESVVLSGGGALLRGLDAYVQDMFSLPVTIAHPFSKVNFPAFLEDTLREAGPSFTVAVGIALRTFEKKD